VRGIASLVPRAHGRQILAALVGLGLVIAVVRLHTYDEPLERDLTSYAVIAHELLGGRPLYSDLWDHKPPAIHATYAIGELLAGYGPASVYLLGVIAAVLTLVGVYHAAAGVGVAGGLWAASLWTAVSSDLWFQANQPNTEVFINACLIWAFALMMRLEGRAAGLGRFAVIGLLFALASLYKQVALAPAAALLVAHGAFPPAATSRRRAVADVVLASGVIAAAWGAVLGYFAATGRLSAFVDAVFAYNRAYAGSLSTNLARGLHPSLLVPTSLAIVLPLAVLTIGGALIALRAAESRRIGVLFLALLGGAYVAIALPRFFHAHYYQLWLPPLTAGAGWAIGFATRRAAWRYAWLPHALAAALVILVIVNEAPAYRFTPEDWSRIKYKSEIFIFSKELGHELDMLLAPGETFYQWGNESGLYFASRRSPPTGTFFVFPLVVGPLADDLSARVVADLTRAQPELVVALQIAFRPEFSHPVLDWLRLRYRPIHDPERGPFLLLVRRGGRLEARLGPTG